jgi:O-antigen ligase
VNATSTVLATTLPFSFYVLHGAETRFWRLIGVLAIVLSITAGVVTFARMTLLVVPPLFLLLAWDSLRDRKARRWAVALGLLALPVLAVHLPWERVHDRAQTIVPELTGGRASEAQLGNRLSYGGRVYHMKVGLAIALDHPLLGAGYNNYGALFVDEYQFTVPGSKRVYTNRRSPHSTYVGIAADLGIVGLVLWFSVLFIVLRQIFRAWTRKQGVAANSTAAALPRAIAYSLLLYVLPYAWYIPHHTDKVLWTLFGMGLAIGQLAKRSPTYNE